MKRLIALFLAVLMLTSAMTVCGVTASAEEHESVVLEIVYPSNPSTAIALDELNAKFTEKYPWVTFNVTTIESANYGQLRDTRLAAEDIDILGITFFGKNTPDYVIKTEDNAIESLVNQGYIMDLTDCDFVYNFDPSAVDASTIGGKVYGVSWGRNSFSGIFYNKAIFAEYGFEEPTTWDAFIAICDKLVEEGITPMTVGAADGWPFGMMMDAFVNAFDDAEGFCEGVWNGSRKFNDESMLNVFDRAAKFCSYFEDGVTSVDYNSAASRFVAGRVAMLPDGSWTAATIDGIDPDFEYGYFGIPNDTEPENGYVQLNGKYDNSWCGAAKTQHPEEVKLWLEFFSDPTNYAEFANTCSFMPAMQVPVENEFVNSLAPKTVNFTTNFQHIFFKPQGAGQYCGMELQFLEIMGGDIKTTAELADLAQKDFDDAYNALAKLSN